ncbi:MAG TPA: hypothetical protein G4O00_10210 [Thermoflexia bacterium]|jgi:hypothetical protein|nr:hypothetical protein [Thermoflexia bacterium]
MEKERGQAVVIVAFSMVALLLAVGLALDGGYLHASRRQAQNGADAAALAGTRVLADAILTCRPGNEADDAAVYQAVLDFAAQNGIPNDGQRGEVLAWYVDAEGNRLGEVGAGTIPYGATGVEVSLTITRPTTFMRLGGINHFRVPGEATGMSGKIVQMAGGILPIGVPLPVIENLGPGEEFYVIETQGGGQFCRKYDNLCIGDPDNEAAHRGWLNLNYIYNTDHLSRSDPLYRTFEQSVPNRGCGPNPETSTDDGLKGWASGECPYPFPIFAGSVGGFDGDFIHGEPGARQSSLKAISAQIGQIVYAPIFDHIYTSDYMAENFSAPEGIGWPRAGGGGQAFLYHVVGFVALEIQEIQGHTLTGTFQEALIGQGQVSPGSGLGTNTWCSTGATPQLFGVTLWH